MNAAVVRQRAHVAGGPGNRRRRRVGVALALGGLAIGLCSCSSYSGTPAQRVREWAAATDFDGNNLETANRQIAADLTNLDNGVRTQDLKGLITECEGFEADVEAVYGALPAPDAALTAEIDTAVSSYWNPAARACQASTSFSSAPFHRYERELALGEAVWARVNKLLSSFGVR